jgi:exodeoxyribonuclease VII small subunit
MTKAKTSDVSGLSFEEAMAELEKIVRQLEEGKINLDDAITAYERGAALKQHAEEKLKNATARLDKIIVTESGIKTTPFETE